MIKTIKGCISQTFNHYVTKDANPEMMDSEFGVIYLKKGESFEIDSKEEYVFCLNQGDIEFSWDNFTEEAARHDCFSDEPWVLHVCTGTSVKISCISETAEINVANTCNNKRFPNKLYRPGDFLCSEVVDKEKLGGKTMRHKCVFFNRETCPETNLFCGEVVNYPGCWACFPPHLHTEPEIYYYKFFPSQGYGFSEFGDEAIKVVNRSVTCNPGNQLHSQATAPGYAGYIMWTQRLQPNGKDIEYKLEENHAWLDREDVRVYPELKA